MFGGRGLARSEPSSRSFGVLGYSYLLWAFASRKFYEMVRAPSTSMYALDIA